MGVEVCQLDMKGDRSSGILDLDLCGSRLDPKVGLLTLGSDDHAIFSMIHLRKYRRSGELNMDMASERSRAGELPYQ
jgi:hypothetical protein